jgi:hypothetical protein
LRYLSQYQRYKYDGPGWPPSRYHLIIEEAYAELRLVETHIDKLRAELEYQHMRLDEIRDIVLTREKQ